MTPETALREAFEDAYTDDEVPWAERPRIGQVMDGLRERGYTVLATPSTPPTLDVEWAKAEAMVPEGWKLRLVWHRDADDPTQRYEARLEKSAHDWTGDEKPRRGWAHSPSAALAALAALAPAAAPAAREDPRPAGPWTGDPADYDGDEGR